MSNKISDYLTVAEAMAELGCSRRGLYRCIDRVGEDVACATVLGKRVILRSKLPLLKEHYYPHYSDAHQAMVKQWGAAGGKAKAANARAAKRAGG